LHLEQVQLTDGNYKPDSTLTYFTTAGLGGISKQQESGHREAVTAWYNQEKAIIDQKDTMLNLQQTELDAEYQAINTELESVKSIIQEEVKKFNIFQ